MENNFKICTFISKEDIVEDIVTFTKGNVSSSSYRDKIRFIIDKAYSNFVCSEDIYIWLNSVSKITIKSLDGMKSIRPNSDNLLVDRFRTHSQMQIVSSSPIINFDESDILNIINGDVEYERYLEERFSFSFDNLLSYVNDRKKHFLIYDERKINGALTYMLNAVDDINILLFMIDFCIKDMLSQNKKIINPLRIMDYASDAIEKHNDIKDRIICGDIKFKQRRRIWDAKTY